MMGLRVLLVLALGAGIGGLAGVVAAAPPTFLLKWGAPGSGPGQFDVPSGMSVDANGFVYVADRGNNRIQKFGPDGTFITAWGDTGSANGQFNNPRGVATDAAGFVYVADTFNNRIQKFTATGSYVAQWGGVNTPRAIAVDNAGFVYVTEDAFAVKQVQKFSDTGTPVASWGSFGTGDGEFAGPRGIAVDDSSYVYVVDTLNDRVQKFTDTGTYVTQWGQTGSGNGDFSFPIGIAWRGASLYVVDQDNHRVQEFSRQGGFVLTFGSFCDLSGGTGCVDPDGGGPLEPGDGQFNQPQGAALDDLGNIYVTDTGNNRVQRFVTSPQVGVGPGPTIPVTRLSAFPNPASSRTDLRFELVDPENGGQADYEVRVEIYDISGRLIRVLFSGRMPSGVHELTWTGLTQSGLRPPPGIFFGRLDVEGSPPRTTKILLLP